MIFNQPLFSVHLQQTSLHGLFPFSIETSLNFFPLLLLLVQNSFYCGILSIVVISDQRRYFCLTTRRRDSHLLKSRMGQPKEFNRGFLTLPLKPMGSQVPMPAHDADLVSSLYPTQLFSFNLCYEEWNPKQAVHIKRQYCKVVFNNQILQTLTIIRITFRCPKL